MSNEYEFIFLLPLPNFLLAIDHFAKNWSLATVNQHNTPLALLYWKLHF